MKLEPRPTLRRSAKAAEVLGAPTEQLDLLFDVEKEVPCDEFEKYKRWLAGKEPTSEQEKKNVVASAWYGLLHPEYRDLMRQSPWLKEFWVKFFASDMEKAVGERQKGNRYFHIRNSFEIAAPFGQVFPERRADLKLTEQAYEWLLENFPPSNESQIYNTAVILLELWPERREIILSTYFPEGAPTELGKITDNWTLGTRLLLFPELRPAARSHLAQKREQYTTEISYWRERFDSGEQDAAGAFNDYLKNLAILSAEQAWIDETGMEHIEMPRRGMRRDVPLPDRPHV
ncbi:MAG: hypothetical protein AAB558_02305 [Patescibacteria group bacterium]